MRGGSTDRELAWDRRAIAVAIGVSLLAHVGFLTWLILVKPRAPISRGQERWTSLQIVRPFEWRPRSDRRVPTTRDRNAATLAPPAAAPPPPAPSPARPPVSNLTPGRSSRSVEANGAARDAGLGRALRNGLIGCVEAKLANLDASRREHCRDVFAGGRNDAPDYGDLALSPEKRAIFDAAWHADHDPQHMAGVGCFAHFGGGKIAWLRPSQGVKLGFLPCYAFGPKATFAAPPPPSRGW